MITEQTVLILGAGASAPYGYATGRRLRRNICQDFAQTFEDLVMKIDDAAIRRYREELVFVAREFVSAFHKSSTQSIDLFLARNRNYYDIGTFSIALEILNAERNSRFREDVPEGHDWYSYLYHRMTSEMPNPDDYELFGKNKVSFVTFNYDRSLEHYLYDSLINSFTSIPLTSVPTRTLMPFEMLHVFGKIAYLPWESESHLDYRCVFNYYTIDEVKGNVKIIFESTDDALLKRIKGEIANAGRIFFLGFGFAKENLETLGVPEVLNDNQKIYGTALGSTANEIAQIRKTLSTNFKIKDPGLANPVIKPVNSYELLREYL